MIDLRFRPLEKPLARPRDGWANSQYSCTWETTLDDLERELGILGAQDIVVEGDFTMEQIRNDGWPRSSAAPSSPGIRLSFRATRQPGKPERSIAVNRFRRWQDNLRAIGLILQRLRLVAEIDPEQSDRVYRGYSALPPSGGIAAAEFGSVRDAMRFLCSVGDGQVLSELASDLPAVYRAAARKAHPDTGGSTDLMAKVNRAKDFVEKGGRA